MFVEHTKKPEMSYTFEQEDNLRAAQCLRCHIYAVKTSTGYVAFLSLTSTVRISPSPDTFEGVMLMTRDCLLMPLSSDGCGELCVTASSLGALDSALVSWILTMGS